MKIPSSLRITPGQTRLVLRLARLKDSPLVWQWANDPEARRVSFQTAPIPWQDHVPWFAQKLDNPDCVYFIAENQHHHPLGQIRFEIDGGEATVSVSLDPAFRGFGFGAKLIELGCRRFTKLRGAIVFRAMIKKSNEISIRSFQKAGFRVTEEIRHHDCPTLILRREEDPA